jgi:hypothetical protein
VAGRSRGRGEGSIYRRKDGRYVSQYEAGRKRQYVHGKTRQEVAGKLAEAIAGREAGRVFDSGNLTLAQYLDGWLDSIRVARCIAPVLWREVDRGESDAFGPGQSLGYAGSWIRTSENSPSRHLGA